MMRRSEGPLKGDRLRQRQPDQEHWRMRVRSGYRKCAIVLAFVTSLAACTPTLNWREVPMEGLVALLPCKPDHAQRKVQLAPSNGVAPKLTMQMSGCEAAGALYAISHVHIEDIAQVQAVQTAWRQATLAALEASNVQAQPLQLAKPVAGQAHSAAIARAASTDTATDTAFKLEKLDAKRPDGSAVQAQLAWLAKGRDIYHVAVYGPKLSREMTELLFSELRLP